MFEPSFSSLQQLSSGWIIVILLALLPLILMLFSPERNPRHLNHEDIKKTSKKKKFPYSGWKVMIHYDKKIKDEEEFIKFLSEECDLYFLAKVKSDQEEQKVKDDLNFFNQDKLLFCETSVGKIAMARQLEVNLYIDNDVDCLKELSRFLPFVGYLGVSDDKLSNISFQSENLNQLINQIKV
eukprot:gene9491-1697_t